MKAKTHWVSLLNFLKEWTKEDAQKKIADGENVFYTNEDRIYSESSLYGKHEEADTRMLLHVQHATTSIINVLVAIPETDAVIMFLSFHMVFTTKIYFRTEVNSTRRIIDITKIVDQWMKYLTHFSLLHLYAPWKRQKTIGFLTFSGSIEKWHWTKMG